MTDIVERLRDAGNDALVMDGITQVHLMHEAAAEIERLRAAIAAEREACARIIDPPDDEPRSRDAGIAQRVRRNLAAAIRARG